MSTADALEAMSFKRACETDDYRESERLLVSWLDHPEYPTDLEDWQDELAVRRAGYYLDFFTRAGLLAKQDTLPYQQRAAKHLHLTLPVKHDLITWWGVKGWALDYGRLESRSREVYSA